MAKGGGGGWMPPPNRFFQFFSEMGRAFLHIKFLPVGSSLGHLSMKNFSDRTCRLGSKIRHRVGAGGGGGGNYPPIEQKLTYFSNLKLYGKYERRV